MVQGLSYSVEHESDAHAGGEHHHDPRDGTEFGLLAVLPQRDAADFAEGQPVWMSRSVQGRRNLWSATVKIYGAQLPGPAT